MEMEYDINGLLGHCRQDMEAAAASGKISLDAQTRAYDLLALLMEGYVSDDRQLSDEYTSVYENVKGVLEAAYDEPMLLSAVANRLAPLERACTDARFEAASIASLHEFAKETHQIWQTSGIFMRKRALKALRERAGFRLESHRIGNYVAKTFDLMNEAQMKFARTQQKVFASDVRYKIKPGLYGKIAEILSANS
jgi:hypothetical protein